jgi:hypothetical protein
MDATTFCLTHQTTRSIRIDGRVVINLVNHIVFSLGSGPSQFLQLAVNGFADW